MERNFSFENYFMTKLKKDHQEVKETREKTLKARHFFL